MECAKRRRRLEPCACGGSAEGSVAAGKCSDGPSERSMPICAGPEYVQARAPQVTIDGADRSCCCLPTCSAAEGQVLRSYRRSGQSTGQTTRPPPGNRCACMNAPMLACPMHECQQKAWPASNRARAQVWGSSSIEGTPSPPAEGHHPRRRRAIESEHSRGGGGTCRVEGRGLDRRLDGWWENRSRAPGSERIYDYIDRIDPNTGTFGLRTGLELGRCWEAISQ